MSRHDQTYFSLIHKILADGEERKDRTGVGTKSIFGFQAEYDFINGFPLLTTKKVRFDGIVRELLWFLKGSTNIQDDLTQHTPIWDAWATTDGELGPIYGSQWRSWGGRGIDQISSVIQQIKDNPDSRRLIVSAWNVEDLDKMALPPCHTMFQFYVRNRQGQYNSGKFLDLQLYQRSLDACLGAPFNIASYSLLLAMVAQECGMKPGRFIHSIGDAHIYLNHMDGLKVQLQRNTFIAAPMLRLQNKPVLEMKYEDIELVGYNPLPFIKFDVAV